MRIGCEVYSIEFWLKHYEDIARENDYTKEQTIRYGEWIKIMSELKTKS